MIGRCSLLPTSHWLTESSGGFRYDFTEAQATSYMHFIVKIAALGTLKRVTGGFSALVRNFKGAKTLRHNPFSTTSIDQSTPAIGKKQLKLVSSPTLPPDTLSAGIFKQSMGARNRVGKVLQYRPARLHSLAELVLWN